MGQNTLKSSFLLVLAAFIWGVAFVAQSVGMDYVGPFTFIGARYLIGGLVLIPCIAFLKKLGYGDDGNKSETQKKEEFRIGVKGGIFCGLALFISSSLQQIGIMYTTVGKAGFITALYIVIVPILGIFMKKKVSWTIWISVAVAVIGMYLLCITDGFSIGTGDIYVFLCAIGFSFHILVIDHFSPKADGVLISCVQFFVAGILGTIVAFAVETPDLKSLCAAWAPVLYAGILSSGAGYTLQIVGQKNMNPVVASLLLSLESVFSLIAGWVLLGQRLSVKEQFGCLLVFCAIILAQLPAPKKKNVTVHG